MPDEDVEDIVHRRKKQAAAAATRRNILIVLGCGSLLVGCLVVFLVSRALSDRPDKEENETAERSGAEIAAGVFGEPVRRGAEQVATGSSDANRLAQHRWFAGRTTASKVGALIDELTHLSNSVVVYDQTGRFAAVRYSEWFPRHPATTPSSTLLWANLMAAAAHDEALKPFGMRRGSGTDYRAVLVNIPVGKRVSREEAVRLIEDSLTYRSFLEFHAANDGLLDDIGKMADDVRKK